MIKIYLKFIELIIKRRRGYRRGVIGVESAIVMIAFVIVAAALAFVILNTGFTTSQKAKTVVISSLSEASGGMQVAGKLMGTTCLTGGAWCGSSLASLQIPFRISSGGDSINLDSSIVRYSSNSVEYDDIYKGVIDETIGFIHVADSFNHRIQVFDSSGNHQLSFGSFGSSDGKFDTPFHMASDPAGNLFIADHFNSRVQVYDSSGNHQLSFGSFGSSDGKFWAMRGIASDLLGNIYVADSGNNRIQVFDSSGKHQLSFGSPGAGDGEFDNPYDVGVDSSGNIYVTEYDNHRIQVFDSSGNHQLSFGSFGSSDGYFDKPRGIAVDLSGNIYVADSRNNRIQVFDSLGNHKLSFGSSGSSDGEFSQPYDIAIDKSGNIYVADSGNNRIQVFDSNGNFQSTFGSSGTGNGEFDSPYGIAVNMYEKTSVSTVGLAAGNALIQPRLDSTFGTTVTQTSAWIYLPVESSASNSILEQGEHATLVIAFSALDRPSTLDTISIELITSDGSTMSVERRVPAISHAIIDLG